MDFNVSEEMSVRLEMIREFMDREVIPLEGEMLFGDPAALEAGVMPATLVNDAPFSAPNGWQPQNSDGQFDGPITVREAMVRSKNLVSIRVLQRVGVDTARGWAQRFGFAPASQPDDVLALGAPPAPRSWGWRWTAKASAPRRCSASQPAGRIAASRRNIFRWCCVPPPCVDDSRSKVCWCEPMPRLIGRRPLSRRCAAKMAACLATAVSLKT